MSNLFDKSNATGCLASQVDFYCERKGISLTPEARNRAINHAVSQWNGRTTAGDAAKAGVSHVTDGVLKEK